MPKVLTGNVVKAKMEKTVVVEVNYRVPHPRYKKMVRRRTKLFADTGSFEVKQGDLVRIQEVRPMSHSKHFKIVEVLQT